MKCQPVLVPSGPLMFLHPSGNLQSADSSVRPKLCWGGAPLRGSFPFGGLHAVFWGALQELRSIHRSFHLASSKHMRNGSKSELCLGGLDSADILVYETCEYQVQ